MRLVHGGLARASMASTGKSAHGSIVETYLGDTQMFVRAVWRIKRLIDLRQTLREMDVPTSREAHNLGLTGPDFSKMTRGLFDR